MNPTSSDRVRHSGRWESREQYFASVYNQNYGKIFRVCQRYSPKSEDARDLAHDVFMQFFLFFGRFRHEASPSTWMHKVAVNLGIGLWRKRKTRNTVGLSEQEWEAIPADIRDNETKILDKISLGKILCRYPERARKILLLHHIEGMTQTEIGTHLGISRSTVVRHLNFSPPGQRGFRG